MYKILCAVSFALFSVAACAGVETKEHAQYDRGVFSLLLGYFPKELSQIITAYAPSQYIITYDYVANSFIIIDPFDGDVVKKILFKIMRSEDTWSWEHVGPFVYCGAGKVAVVVESSNLYLVDIPTGTYEKQPSEIWSIWQMIPFGSNQVIMQLVDELVLWNPFTRKRSVIAKYRHRDGSRLGKVLVALGAEKVAVGFSCGALSVYDVAGKKKIWSRQTIFLGLCEHGISSLAGNDRYVASASRECPLDGVSIWSVENGQFLCALQKGYEIGMLAVLANGDLAISGKLVYKQDETMFPKKSEISVWNYGNNGWKKIKSVLDDEHCVRTESVVELRDGTLIFDTLGLVKVWQTGTHRLTNLYNKSPGTSLLVCPSKDVFPAPLQKKRTFRDYLNFARFRKFFKKKRE